MSLYFSKPKKYYKVVRNEWDMRAKPKSAVYWLCEMEQWINPTDLESRGNDRPYLIDFHGD